MSEPFDVLPTPCSSCPYRRDTPPGIWDRSEYERLREFSPVDPWQVPSIATFLCHQTHRIGRNTLCRGWLSVEQESVAVRVLLIKGRITVEQVRAAVPVPLYATGDEAADAGCSGVERPGAAARRMMRKLARVRRRRR